MKTTSAVLWLLFSVCQAIGQESVSIAQFTSLTPDERAKLIEQAPADQKEKLEEIDLHLALLAHYGGEEGLRAEKGRYVVKARGFEWLQDLFLAYHSLRDSYIGGVEETNIANGMSREKSAEMTKQLLGEMGPYGGKMPIIDSLLINLAPSPQAFALNAEAQRVCMLLDKRIVRTDEKTPFPIITKEERLEFDKHVDEILVRLKELPALPPSEVQKECEQVPERKLNRYSSHL